MLLQQLGDSRLELATIVALEYVGTGERTNLVNVGDHVDYVLHLFCFHRSSDLVSGSDVDPERMYLYLFLYNISKGMYNKSN